MKRAAFRIVESFRRNPHRVLLIAASLAPLIWLHDGHPIKGVDSFFSLHPVGRLTSSAYAWDARTSAGEPQADLIAVGLNGLQASLRILGVPVVMIQALVLIGLAAFSVWGMYRLARELLPADSEAHRRDLVAACVAIAWVANPFALSFVWFHQLLTEFTWALLPWLLWLLVTYTRGSRRADFVIPATILATILGAPGLPHIQLVSLAALFVLLSLGLIATLRDRTRAAGRAALFIGAFAIGVAWWVIPTIAQLRSLLASAGVESSSLAQFKYSSQFSGWANVVTLTAQPALYTSAGPTPYISWSGLVSGPLGSVLRFTLPAGAVLGAAVGFRRRFTRALVVALCAGAVLAAFVSKGLNGPFGSVNLELTKLPFGESFRHPVDKLSVLMVPALCLLFGSGVLWLFRRFTALPIGALVIVCGWLALPWWTGSVVPSGGDPLPSAHVTLPHSYKRVGALLGQSQVGGKTMVLPYSLDGGSAFRWQSGIQPNLDPLLEDWAPNRSLIAVATGERYPDMLGPVVLHAVRSEDPRAFDLAHLWGVDTWLVHADWATDYMPPSVGPDDANSFLINPLRAKPSEVPRKNQLVALTASTATLQLDVRTASVPTSEDRFLRIGTVYVEVNQQGYFALYDPTRGFWDPGLPPSRIGMWHTIGVHFTDGRMTLSVDGVRRGQGIPAPPRPVFAEVLPPCSSCGVTLISRPRESTRWLSAPDRARLPFAARLLVESEDLFLYQQPALPVVYAARSVFALTGVSPGELLSAASLVASDPAPVLLDPGDLSRVSELDPNATTTWQWNDPAKWSGRVTVTGSTVLVLSQSFDPNWQLILDGSPVPASHHFVVNGFANGWLISGTGAHEWVARYTLQRSYDLGLAAGVGLLVGCCAALALRRKAITVLIGSRMARLNLSMDRRAAEDR